MNREVIIIGAGVIGCSIARELSKYDFFNVTVLEKEGDVAEGISKANSGVLHAGFNVPTGSLKAKFNVEGLNFFPKFAEELNIPYKLCKKLVIAKNDDERSYLEKLLEQGKRNNCHGLSIIDKQQIKNIEPNVSGKYALFSEKTAIISPYEFTIALAESAYNNGVKFHFYEKVEKIIKSGEKFQISTQNKFYNCDILINAAGLFSDDIFNSIESKPMKIHPVRGEYFILDSNNNNLITSAIYPVPPKDGRGLGVHLTPTLNGNILIGPSAELINNKIDVGNNAETMYKLKKEAIDLLPALKDFTFIKNYSGIRPKLFRPGSSQKFADFFIGESDNIENMINLIGIESPGLTSAPAIAKHVVENIIGNKYDLVKKDNFNFERVPYIRTKELEIDQKQKLFKENSDYGEIICRCEQISKAEIIEAIKNPLNAKTLNAIKKRTHAMMGRCQSGFCLPKITSILIEEFGITPEKIIKNSQNSNNLLRNDD